MGVLLASGPVSGVQVKTGCWLQAPVLPGSDPPSRLQRALSSWEELGAGRAASGPGSSPHRPLLFITHRKKTTSLKMQTREAEGGTVRAPGCVLSIFALGVVQERLAPRSRP